MVVWGCRGPHSPMSNPFSTRNICPAATEFRFPVGMDVDRQLGRLRRSGWWGQIVGPHGSGKSTLVHALLARMEGDGRRVDLFAFHPCDKGLSLFRRHARGWDGRTQVVIDGHEQLGWLERLWLKRQCRKRGTGLLVTAHDDAGLPELWRTETTIDLACSIVACLLPPGYDSWVTDSDVSRAFSEHRGNLRETLLTLYDVFERRAERFRQMKMAGRVQIAPSASAIASA